jgi:hypothetical protein
MPKRKLPPNQDVIDMYDSGMSTGEIAEKCGVQPITVSCLLRRLGHKQRSAKEAAKVCAERGRTKKTSYWLGKTQPPAMVEKRVAAIRGDKHWLWKGGKDRRGYRRKVSKEQCELCGTCENLGIHHRDFDHYHDDPDNLQVLCVSCHMSLHKQAYWNAVHSGQMPPVGNAPIGWRREGKEVING